ncbi:protein ENL-like isoform X3 [Ornithorhynchus anatinus]|uniref:protein ENL-like isoform X3 n=1 Tax=Ornithorhynchus anatinus TaxID=9258 RepID=UPI0010A8C081|nr:protein ENL-like isoform X3 [Ornithorhynchus anatinus]
MDNQCIVQVKLELGHRAQLRKKPTIEGFTHDWMVFVRGPEQCDVQHFVDKVVFRLHESFPKPKRVCKEPPYRVEESGYAGFIMPIEVYFKNKEKPKKVCFTYDLFLNLEGNPPVNHLRCEKLTFNNPTKEFRYKLLKAGGDAKKENSKAPKPLKITKDHQVRSKKNSESKGVSRDLEQEQKPSVDLSSKHIERKLLKEKKMPPKLESKLTVREILFKNQYPSLPPEPKSFNKGPFQMESSKPSSRKQKSSSKEKNNDQRISLHITSSLYPENKLVNKKMNTKVEKGKYKNEAKESKKPMEPEFNSEDESSFKSESLKSSPFNPSYTLDYSSDFDFQASQKYSEGALSSMVGDLQAEGSDDDSSCGEDAVVKANPVNDSRLSISDSDSLGSCLPNQEHAPTYKLLPASQEFKRKSPEPCNIPEKVLKKGTYDKAYTDELVELHKRLMALRERNILQQIVNLIEETGHFNVTNTTFDFDLFSLDETTIRKLQGYLDTVAI